MYEIPEFKFNRDKCWYKNVCLDYQNKDLCHCACPMYKQYQHLVNTAYIPERLQYAENLQMTPGKDANEFKYLENIRKDIVNWVEEGNNLYLYSNEPGNGKTTWSIKLMCTYFDRIVEQVHFERRGLFLNVDEFIVAKKAAITKRNPDLEAVEAIIPTIDLVIWDDIGMMPLSPYDHSFLYTLINQRIVNNKSNIFTSNVIDELLQTRVGTRLCDRILNTSDIVEFINPSQRKPIRKGGRK